MAKNLKELTFAEYEKLEYAQLEIGNQLLFYAVDQDIQAKQYFNEFLDTFSGAFEHFEYELEDETILITCIDSTMNESHTIRGIEAVKYENDNYQRLI